MPIFSFSAILWLASIPNIFEHYSVPLIRRSTILDGADVVVGFNTYPRLRGHEDFTKLVSTKRIRSSSLRRAKPRWSYSTETMDAWLAKRSTTSPEFRRASSTLQFPLFLSGNVFMLPNNCFHSYVILQANRFNNTLPVIRCHFDIFVETKIIIQQKTHWHDAWTIDTHCGRIATCIFALSIDKWKLIYILQLTGQRFDPINTG